jgi:hypothetical protein
MFLTNLFLVDTFVLVLALLWLRRRTPAAQSPGRDSGRQRYEEGSERRWC